MPAAFLGIARGQENLRDMNLVRGEGFLPRRGQSDLSGGGRSLFFLKFEGALAASILGDR